jgi:hypothetical protein
MSRMISRFLKRLIRAIVLMVSDSLICVGFWIGRGYRTNAEWRAHRCFLEAVGESIEEYWRDNPLPRR